MILILSHCKDSSEGILCSLDANPTGVSSTSCNWTGLSCKTNPRWQTSWLTRNAVKHFLVTANTATPTVGAGTVIVSAQRVTESRLRPSSVYNSASLDSPANLTQWPITYSLRPFPSLLLIPSRSWLLIDRFWSVVAGSRLLLEIAEEGIFAGYHKAHIQRFARTWISRRRWRMWKCFQSQIPLEGSHHKTDAKYKCCYQIFDRDRGSNPQDRRGNACGSSYQVERPLTISLNSVWIVKLPLGALSNIPTLLSFWASRIEILIFRQVWYHGTFCGTIFWRSLGGIQKWNGKRYVVPSICYIYFHLKLLYLPRPKKSLAA